MNVGGPLALIALLAATLLAGCTCEQTLEVSACPPDSTRCMLAEGEAAIEWTPAHAEAWPGIEARMDGIEVREHRHNGWGGDSDAFWTAMGIDPADSSKQVYIMREGQLLRVRILEC